MAKSVVWFEEVGKGDVGIVGGKGANLGELSKKAFPVPPGFVVTAHAYFGFLDEAGIRKRIVEKIDAIDVENTGQLRKVTEEVRKIILGAPVPENLIIEIKKAYNKISDRKLGLGLTSSEEEYVAVRSSATAEDLPEASFAGQQETYLNVIGRDEVVDKVRQCWASLFTARATYYRKRQGFKTEQVGIAVVVQKMVNSETAGVMFTDDPSGREGRIIIEGAYGLGEVVVSGALTPDTYVVDKKNFSVIEKKMSEQSWMLLRSGRGSKKTDVEFAKRKRQKVADDNIVKIAKLGVRIENHYGAPQDIEWAIEGKNIYIVQSRAITTLKKKSGADEKRGKDERVRGKALAKGGKEIVSGLCASPGIVSGIAKVIPSVDDVEKVRKGDIIVTKMTSPDWVPAMEKSIAIITDEGGTTCHAAIVSRELGIPCIVGSENATSVIRDGQEVTVDGYNGKVYDGRVDVEAPEEERLKDAVSAENAGKVVLALAGIFDAGKQGTALKGAEDFARQIVDEFGEKAKEGLSGGDAEKAKEKLLSLLRRISPGVKVNVALMDAAEKASKTGADGVGLLRAEHMITGSGKHPAEFIREDNEQGLVDEVKKGVGKVAELFKGKPVWFRTFDARTDEFRSMKGGEKEPKEDNPMLGWHGIRRDLDEPEILRAQFRAIKELMENGHENIGVMLPFVQSVEELKRAKEIAKECGLSPDDEKLDFGIMVETPAAVWVIDEMINEGLDFVSFGTNDLTQLTLGIDRNNERIQKQFTEMHPAVVREIEHVIKICNKRGVQTSICGQAGSKPEMVRKLIDLGISSVSANIDAVGKVRNVVLTERLKMLLEAADGEENGGSESTGQD
ncbi:phosphoenolpyruvate synthase [Candidatus Micrarchaeota archaeon]|nr:phosphoenolpyruvate synthase [Candidatus Micrarchaeota archaeon]